MSDQFSVTSQDRDDADLSARATLTLLRGLSQDAHDVRRDVILVLPSFRPLTSEDAVSLLVNLHKPVSCISLQCDRVIAIGWWLRDAEQERSWMEMRRNFVQDSLEPYHVESKIQSREATIALLAGDEVLPLPLSACEQWLLSYHFPLVSHHLTPATGHLARAGFAGVMRPFRSTGAWITGYSLESP